MAQITTISFVASHSFTFCNSIQQFIARVFRLITMLKIVIPFFTFSLICCKQPSFNKPSLSFKDSLTIEQLAILDSCIHLKKITELNTDEVYRFSHGEAFCFYRQRVTVTRKGDSILLHYLEYGGTDDGNVIEYQDKTGLKRFGPDCRIEKEFYKSLGKEDWEDLEKKIEDADYWGLEERDVRVIRDGSSWQIDAYTRQSKKINGPQVRSVYRNRPNNNSFASLGLFLMKLAEEKGMCGEFN